MYLRVGSRLLPRINVRSFTTPYPSPSSAAAAATTETLIAADPPIPPPPPASRSRNFLKISVSAAVVAAIGTAGYATYAYDVQDAEKAAEQLRSLANCSVGDDASGFEKFKATVYSTAIKVPLKTVELYIDTRRAIEDHVRGFTEPSSENLLPDLHPQEQHVFTLVLDLNETLVYSDWTAIQTKAMDSAKEKSWCEEGWDESLDLYIIFSELFRKGKGKSAMNIETYCYPPKLDISVECFHTSRERGWRTFKRPGVEAFLEHLAKFYEIVVYSDQLMMYVDPVIERLDQKGCIRYRLARNATLYKDGKHYRDLSKLNRDPSRVLYISGHALESSLQPENSVPIKPWKLENDDTALLDLIPFLEYVAVNRPSDIRPVLATYQGRDIASEFIERSREHQRRMQEQKQHGRLWRR